MTADSSAGKHRKPCAQNRKSARGIVSALDGRLSEPAMISSAAQGALENLKQQPD